MSLRKVLLLMFFWAFLAYDLQAQDDMRLIGLGSVITTSPYAGVGERSQVVPVVVWDQGSLYIKGVEVGYTFYDEGSFRSSLITAPRFMGFSSDDSDSLKGMEDAESSLDVGLRAGWKLPGPEVELGLKLVGDALSRHDGFEADLALSQKIKGRIWRLTPSLGVRFQSKDMVDYYYGVSSGEVRSGRSAYAPDGVLNYYANVMFNFGIHKDWVVLTRCGVEFLGQEVRDSPIVSRDALVVGVVGLARRF